METPAIKADFIPKQKGLHGIRYHGPSGNVLFIVSIALLVLVLLGWGGLLLYKYTLERDNKMLQDELREIVASGVDNTVIAELESFDNKLKTVKAILDNHTDLPLLFALIESGTLSNSIRFSDFSYSVANGTVTVSMSGTARSFASLRYQEQILEGEDLVVNPEFSSIAIDETTGFVNFQLVYELNRSATLFSRRQPANE